MNTAATARRTERDHQIEEKHAEQLSRNVFTVIAVGFVAFVGFCLPVLFH